MLCTERFTWTLKYETQGHSFTAAGADTPHFSLEIRRDAQTVSVSIRPKVPLTIQGFRLTAPYTYTKDDRIFVNGYQSWTDSLEYCPDGQMQELSALTEFLVDKSPFRRMGMNKSGDLRFHSYPRKPGIFYGWSYGYVRRGDQVELFGSLSERAGYTIVTFDTNAGTVEIGKDLEGVVFSRETTLLELACISDSYDAAFDRYFERMGVACTQQRRRTGYTTWYNYYGNVREEDVLRDLQSMRAVRDRVQVDCFQIDDGYQTAIGDWLSVDEKKFPSGMQKIADSIHDAGMLAGLWLAPFAGVKSSALYRTHPDWLIRGADGKPYKTGHNWGGFYSLDIYNPDVRSYLQHVFDVVLNEWGFDLVKLDFLYGACVLPLHGKSRGEVMCDAMDLLRKWCGDKLILGCGVPLMPAFGKVDYCRIGSDISMRWKRQKHAIREEVSTPHAVCNTIFRRHLNGRAWMNDPDVFLLRDGNNKLSMEQRALLAQINSVFGSLLFVSDDVRTYTPEQMRVFESAFAPKQVKILRAEFTSRDEIFAEYIVNGEHKTLRFNVWTGERLG